MSSNNGYTLLCGTDDFAGAALLPALPPFDRRVLSFLGALSNALLKDKANRAYPDITTFAFFCRTASLEQMKKPYADCIPHRIGRGLTFHIAPGNVPINFAYSLVSALLAGNVCIVKASSRDFVQTRIVCDAMRTLLETGHVALKPYVNVITYDRSHQDITERLSALCDVRVVWGGDETVQSVRSAPLSPRAVDITFADRYSLLCVRTSAILAMDEKQLAAMAQGFFNDTYLSDQNACTSPRLVYWLDDTDSAVPHAEGAAEAQAAHTSLQAAQTRFWNAIHAYAASRYSVPPVVAVDKLDALYRAAVLLPDNARVSRVPMPDNLIARIRVERLTPQVDEIRAPGGCFVEYADTSLDALAPIVKRKYQTLSYLGFDAGELRAFVLERGLSGIDRIVPIGKTMDFSLTWDGYDLIRTLSRSVQAI